MTAPLDPDVAIALCLEHSDRSRLLHSKDGRHIYRVASDHGSVIVKTWDFRSSLKRLLSFTVSRRMFREAHALKALAETPICAPRLFGKTPVAPRHWPTYYAIVMEDLGDLSTAMEYLKQLLSSGVAADQQRFEGEVICLTKSLIETGIFERDHSLNNLMVNDGGQLCRVDFECALVRDPNKPPVRDLGLMLGRLILTHVFAVQPATSLTKKFVERLLDNIQPPPEALTHTRRLLDTELHRQRATQGIETRLSLSW